MPIFNRVSDLVPEFFQKLNE